MEAEYSRKHLPPWPVRPGEPAMPEKIMQNGSFYREGRGEQVIQLEFNQSRQYCKLNPDADGAYEREPVNASSRVHAILSSL
jgi:hypothetical protein